MVQQLGLWVSLLRAYVQSLVRELRSHSCMAQPKKVSSFYLTLVKHCWELKVSIHIWYFLFKSRKLYTSLGSLWLTTIRWIIIILKWIITSTTESIELKKNVLWEHIILKCISKANVTFTSHWHLADSTDESRIFVD